MNEPHLCHCGESQELKELKRHATKMVIRIAQADNCICALLDTLMESPDLCLPAAAATYISSHGLHIRRGTRATR